MASSDPVITKPEGALSNDAVQQGDADPFVKQGLTAEDIDQKIETIEATADTTVLTTTHKVSAYAGAAQSIAAGTGEIIELNTESYDLGSDFNTSTFKFTAPITGYYLVVAQMKLTGMADGKNAVVYVKKNTSTTVLENQHWTGAAGSAYPHVAGIVSLTQGDTLELQGENGDASDRNTGAGAGITFMDIHLIST